MLKPQIVPPPSSSSSSLNTSLSGRPKREPSSESEPTSELQLTMCKVSGHAEASYHQWLSSFIVFYREIDPLPVVVVVVVVVVEVSLLSLCQLSINTRFVPCLGHPIGRSRRRALKCEIRRGIIIIVRRGRK